ncbi:MAG: DUF1566 domain-containing protein [Ilumatobacteraceae bacterium]|nr:DUF1566 domain-containing protein [Ilumatobacteraceae bacterium]
MKRKAPFAFLMAATCVLAACSDSSSSGGTSDSRVKNEALAVVAPVINKIEPGDSSLTVFVSLPDGSAGNIWFYQVSAPAGAANPLGDGTETVDNAPASFVINGLTNGATYTIRVAHWNNGESSYVSATGTPGPAPTTTVLATSTTTSSTTTVAPTTLPPTTTNAPTTTLRVSTCQTGGDCAIGDTGPGGGIVFYDAGSIQPWGRYLEVAPNDLTPAQFGCVGSEPPSVAAVGAGFANSYEVSVSTCANNSAAQAAFTYTLRGSTGWYLPSRGELNELCKYANNQETGDSAKACTKGATLRTGFSPTYYWSSTQNGPNFAWYQSFVTGQQYGYGKPAPAAIRPIRAFANKDGVTVPTTIAAPRCNRGGECKVGDTGPGGGIVFYVAPTIQPWGQYMEIAPVTFMPYGGSWGCSTSGVNTSRGFGTGPANTRALVSKGCQPAVEVDRYVSPTGVDDWFMPSVDEAVPAGQAGLLNDSRGTWSSSTDGCLSTYCFYFSVDATGRPKDSASPGSGGSSTGTGVRAIRMFRKVG